jgi:riboflavin transporter FmnP
MRNSKLHRLVGMAVLGAIGYVLMLFEFPVLPAFPFLKLDVSDVAILLALLLYGAKGAVGTALVRSLLHFILTGAGLVNLVGDSASFLASVGLMIPLAILISKQYSWRRAAIGMIGGTITMTVIMSVLNLVVIMPMYMAVMNFHLGMSTMRYVLIGVVPFNLIKGAVLTIVFLVVAKAMNYWLSKHTVTHAAE